MERQKTQRIIGIFVIIAFVIILIPLFFGKTEISTQVTSLKTPPLPEQQSSAQNAMLAKADMNEGQTPDDSAILGTPAPTAVNTPMDSQAGNSQNPQADTQMNPAPESQPMASADDSLLNQNPNGVVPNAPSTAGNDLTPNQPNAPMNNGSNLGAQPGVPSSSLQDNAAQSGTQKMSSQDENAADISGANSLANSPPIENAKAQPTRDVFAEPVHSVKKHKITTASKKQSAKPVNFSNKEIEKFNSIAWAVQMGNFKDKTNAKRLADKLREAGYKAFTKEIHSAKGNISTRVYIGPEFKQASAVQISNKVEQQLNMKGIVVNIKPLEI